MESFGRRTRGGAHLCGTADTWGRLIVRRTAKAALPREALELVAQRFRALGDATRLALLQALFDGERTVAELSAVTGTTQANTSKHLGVLLERGLVERRRDGLFTRYRVADPMVQRLCHVVCGALAERHATMRAHLGGRGPG